VTIEFHRKMLADQLRSRAFAAALRQAIVPGQSTVVDIGAGTGILGFMARRLGAREVHLVEQGEVLALAARLAADNGIDGLHYWQAHSTEIIDPPQVDVAVAEVLGNFALEENALETLADARRFLRPGGVLIPSRLEQWIAPVTGSRLRDELCSWDDAPMQLDFGAARAMSLDNIYVRSIGPDELLAADAARRWDILDFATEQASRRAASVSWQLASPARVHGFALWWRCELVPGIHISTSPLDPPTHWEQVYAPVASVFSCDAGDELGIRLEAETGGGEAGISLLWEVTQRRGSRTIARCAHDISRGWIG